MIQSLLRTNGFAASQLRKTLFVVGAEENLNLVSSVYRGFALECPQPALGRTQRLPVAKFPSSF